MRLGKENGNATYDMVSEGVASLKSDIGKLVDQLKTDGADMVGDKARRLYGSLSDEGGRSVAALSRKVEQRPLVSLLIAFTAGFLGGRILMR